MFIENTLSCMLQYLWEKELSRINGAKDMFVLIQVLQWSRVIYHYVIYIYLFIISFYERVKNKWN